jgi:hypothetical protein
VSASLHGTLFLETTDQFIWRNELSEKLDEEEHEYFHLDSWQRLGLSSVAQSNGQEAPCRQGQQDVSEEH